MPSALWGFHEAFHSQLASQGEDSTAFQQQDKKHLVPSVKIPCGEKCRTVMHEAIVAQLHPQDQRFLPGSAVTLQQRNTKKRREGTEEREETDWSKGEDGVNE